MATSATPNGAEPVNTLSASGSYTGKVRHIKIASGYSTAIFYGDFVKLVAAGTLEKAAVTTSVVAGTVGIFVGCSYTDPSTSQMTFNQQFPASTAASDIMAYVVDDPKLVFKMQGDEAIAQTGLGNNISAVSTAGSTSIGRSKNALDGGSIATTNTLPLRVLEFVEGPNSTVGDAFTDCLVTYLPLSHAYETKLGV
ncbi:MAG: hypothetical protein CMF29_00990 [Kiritimatiellaceae bacterium]|nr:hypothetical protein [Kiritimatiellaceae bacterium]|tara:strand:- start:934 stop:1521 length:588 start_codon:yes stop_codon:yes gene_type:complete